MTKVAEKAIVHPKAVLEEGVEIGPYSLVGENVRIGKGTKIGSYVLLEGRTTIGENCQVHAGAVVGTVPQDLKFKGAKSFLSIGNGTVIREYATINRATDEGGTTRIGEDNLLMAYVHVAHNCEIGNNVIMANVATLAGHVTIEDKAVIGGLSAIHQFVKVGTVSIVGGCSKVVKDVPPYIKADGHPLKPYGLNIVGLKRNNFPPKTRALLKKAYRILYNSKLNISQAVLRIAEEVENCPQIDRLLQFIRTSERGIVK
jgi:UDP-N-acetylglucosamine acyltransferase